MNQVAGMNMAGFALAVGLSTAIAWLPGSFRASREPDDRASDATKVLRDHAGNEIDLRDFRHIASASVTADQLLLELCEPDRIAAFTPYTARPRSFRFSGKPTVQLHDLESILALRPDLVLVSGNGDVQPIARLREAGVVVFDLGDTRGMSTLLPDIRDVSELLGAPARGERLAADLVAAMASVAADIPQAARRRGMYVSVYGGRLFGGSTGTSYDDVLVAAGLTEAADQYRDWPALTPENVLDIDPDVVVTNTGMRDRICEHAGLESLRSCKTLRGLVEIDGPLLSDTGPDMVAAARAVRLAVYGPPPRVGGGLR